MFSRWRGNWLRKYLIIISNIFVQLCRRFAREPRSILRYQLFLGRTLPNVESMTDARVIWVKWAHCMGVLMAHQPNRKAIQQDMVHMRIGFGSLQRSGSPILPFFVKIERKSVTEEIIKKYANISVVFWNKTAKKIILFELTYALLQRLWVLVCQRGDYGLKQLAGTALCTKAVWAECASART